MPHFGIYCPLYRVAFVYDDDAGQPIISVSSDLAEELHVFGRALNSFNLCEDKRTEWYALVAQFSGESISSEDFKNNPAYQASNVAMFSSVRANAQICSHCEKSGAKTPTNCRTLADPCTIDVPA